jgi:hypothetical protein
MLKQRAQTANPKLEQHKELPLSESTLPPEPMQQCNMGVQQKTKNLLTLPKAVRLPS